MKKMKFIFILLMINIQAAFSFGRYELKADAMLLDAKRTISISQIGVREKTGHNDGPEVEAYLRSVGLRRGNPYCMSGQYWCFKEAHEILKIFGIVAKIPIPRTGHANTPMNYAIKYGVKTLYVPQVDDLLIWWNTPGNKRSSGHIESILEIGRAGWVITLGFNTSNGLRGSQREGNGVFPRKRNIRSPIGRLRVRGLVGFSRDYAGYRQFIHSIISIL